MNITRHPFGELSSGQSVEEFTIRNSRGMQVSVISYGGIVREILVPDREGHPVDLVLGFDSLEGYLGSHPFFGVTVGRVAGRISGGSFVLNGKEYSLELNDPPNHLHGGSSGFDKQLWVGEVESDDTVALGYVSPDCENGYPGNLSVTVRYRLTEENELIIDYTAETDKATPCSLTDHSYFNLAGESSGSVEDHELAIFAEEYTPTDEKMTLLGRVEAVSGRPNDLREPQRIGDVVSRILNGHGDNYLLSRQVRPEPALAARAVDPASGRTLEVLTTERCLQFYSGTFLDGSLVGKSGRPYGKHGAFCLECQGYPDGANHPEINDTIVRPGETYRQQTIYRFSF